MFSANTPNESLIQPSLVNMLMFRKALEVEPASVLDAQYSDVYSKVANAFDSLFIAFYQYSKLTPETTAHLYRNLANSLAQLCELFNNEHHFAGIMMSLNQAKQLNLQTVITNFQAILNAEPVVKVRTLLHLANQVAPFFKSADSSNIEALYKHLHKAVKPQASNQSAEIPEDPFSTRHHYQGSMIPTFSFTSGTGYRIRNEDSMDKKKNIQIKLLLEDEALPTHHFWIDKNTNTIQSEALVNETDKITEALALLVDYERRKMKVTTVESACRILSRIEFGIDNYASLRKLFINKYLESGIEETAIKDHFISSALRAIISLRDQFKKFPVDLDAVYRNQRSGVEQDIQQAQSSTISLSRSK